MFGVRCSTFSAFSEVLKYEKTQNTKGGRPSCDEKPCSRQPERKKTGEQMAWAPHLVFLHCIWLISVRWKALRIWEYKKISTEWPTFVQPSERFEVEWPQLCQHLTGQFRTGYYWRTRRRRARVKGSSPELAMRILYCQGSGAIQSGWHHIEKGISVGEQQESRS